MTRAPRTGTDKALPGKWDARREADLADDLDILLGDLCTQWGFCNRVFGADLLRGYPIVTDEIFALAVLTAAGWDPARSPDWYLYQQDIAALFRRRYGASVSRATHAPDG
jgi:hypothetical protein